MAVACASSPVSSRISAFKSPLRALRAEAGERIGCEDAYADAQARLAQWRKHLVSGAGFEAQQGLRDLHHQREQLQDLQADLASVQSLVEAAKQLEMGGSRLAEVLQTSTEAADARAQAMLRISDELRELCDKRRREIQEEERKLARQQEAADTQHAEALKMLSTYSERLGLTITRVAPQTVRMTFSLLDRRNLEREFSFTLGLCKASEAYMVSTCDPEVPELPKLLEALNSQASAVALPRFVCSMRRAFLKLASAASTA